MLTRTLRGLESYSTTATAFDLVIHRIGRETYSLTHLGSTIIAPLRGMCRWAKRYRMNVSADLHLEGA